MASFGDATRTTTQVIGEWGLAELNLMIDKLASMMNTFAPVVKELKTAYDAARNEEDILQFSGEKDGESVTDGEPGEPPAKKGSSDGSKPSQSVLVEDLVRKVTEDEHHIDWTQLTFL